MNNSMLLQIYRVRHRLAPFLSRVIRPTLRFDLPLGSVEPWCPCMAAPRCSSMARTYVPLDILLFDLIPTRGIAGRLRLQIDKMLQCTIAVLLYMFNALNTALTFCWTVWSKMILSFRTSALLTSKARCGIHFTSMMFSYAHFGTGTCPSCSYQGDVINIKAEGVGTWVINKHLASRQIWLSSPVRYFDLLQLQYGSLSPRPLQRPSQIRVP